MDNMNSKDILKGTRMLPSSLRTHTCGELRARHAGMVCTLCGWVHQIRDHGKIIFLTMRDRYGITQLVHEDAQGRVRTQINALASEYCIACTGTVRSRPQHMHNSAQATGAIEMVVTSISVLSACAPLPFNPHDDAETKDDLRQKFRYIDLRSQRMHHNMVLRHRVMQAARMFLSSNNFLEIETPTLVRSTPEGARDLLVPSRTHPHSFYALAQSPQLYKQLLMVGGYDRYFQLARCYRDEDARGDRQIEHTQMDIEMSFVQCADIYALIEGLLEHVFATVLRRTLPTPFPRLTYDAARLRYCSDKPDMRYALRVYDCGAWAATSNIRFFHDALQHGGVVRMMHVSACDISRAQLAALEEIVKAEGCKGLAWTRIQEGQCAGGVAKMVNPYMADIMKSVVDGEAADAAAHTDETAACTDETAARTDETAARTDDAAAHTTDAAAHTTETAAHTTETAAHTDETAACTTDAAAHTTETAAHTTETAAHTDETAARTDAAAAHTTDATAHTDETAARTDDAAAHTTETAAHTTDATAHTDETAARTDETAACTTDAAAHTTETAAHTTETAAHTDETAACTTDAAAHTTETAARTDAAAAHTTETAARTDAAAAHTTETAARTDAAAAHTTDAAAHTTDATAHTDETAARTTETAAHTDETAARTDAAAAHTTETAAHTDDAAARTDETAARTDAAAAHTDETAARTAETAAHTTETAAHTTETAAHTDETAARTDETAARTTDATARTDETAARTTETDRHAPIQNGDMLFFLAGAEKTVVSSFNALRLHIIAHFNPPKETHYTDNDFAFAWITDFPLFEWDDGAGKWNAAHHMFSMPHAQYIDSLEQDPGKARGAIYDLVCNGSELASGSIRIHSSEIQQRIFNIIGLSAEEATRRFGFLLEAFRYGPPPHGGIAPGLDRLVSLLATEKSIREVIAFPKNNSGASLLDTSPAPVGTSQLQELSIACK